MLVTRNDILSLKQLSSTKEVIAIDSIPEAFKPDFQLFFIGKTLFKRNNALFAYPHDIKAWTLYMFEKYNE